MLILQGCKIIIIFFANFHLHKTIKLLFATEKYKEGTFHKWPI